MSQNAPVDWAVEFDSVIWRAIESGNHQAVIDFQKLGAMARNSHPSYDHFLPLLYCLGLKTADDSVSTFNDNFQWPAVSMRSVRIG